VEQMGNNILVKKFQSSLEKFILVRLDEAIFESGIDCSCFFWL